MFQGMNSLATFRRRYAAWVIVIVERLVGRGGARRKRLEISVYRTTNNAVRAN